MDRAISRRDFINGTAAVIGAAQAGRLGAATGGSAAPETSYPPARTGMRGAHAGAFESAHLLRDGQLSLDDAEATGETYDCVIVGGGISGLAAAHFFTKYAGPSVRVLVLDNHDDFGGHAKRNEFRVDGKLLAINGGTLNIESPGRYNQWSRTLLDDLGVDLDRYGRANDANHKLYQGLGLGRGTFLDRETWGKDRLLVSPPGRGGLPPAADLPLTGKARADYERLMRPDQPDYLAGRSVEEKKAFLAKTSLEDYYLKTVGVDPKVMWFFRTFGYGSFCVGADATPALFGWVQDMPGFSGLGLGALPDGLFAELPGGHHGRQKESGVAVHFPDGNATLTRLLVAKLVPGATPGRSQEDMGTAVIDYGALDRPNQPTRIRLNSVVVNVRHDGEAGTAREAVVSYIVGGRLRSVRAQSVILASWNMMLPYLMPELPDTQKEALAYGVKGPLVYTNVALRNWRAWERLKVHAVECPGMFHDSVELTEAASLGDLHHAASPAEPVALHLVKTMAVPGLPRRDQHRAGRQLLLEMSFEHFERETRSQLSRVLAGSGFDAARDIAGITVNRWPHGYAYTYNSLYDPVEWVYTSSPDRPCVVGRKPFGLVSIANSDAAASPHTDAAILEAHRAVMERLERRAFPFAAG
jgi:spermidine dehydrogenase